MGRILPDDERENGRGDPHRPQTGVTYETPYREFPNLTEVDVTYVFSQGGKFLREEGTILAVDKENAAFIFEPHYTDEDWAVIIEQWRKEGGWTAEHDAHLSRVVRETEMPMSTFLTHRKHIPLSVVRSMKRLRDGKVAHFSDFVVLI